MSDSYRANLTLWPATPLPASAAKELRKFAIDVHRLPVDDSSVALSRSEEGVIVMQVNLNDLPGVEALDQLLGCLRMGNVNYVAWLRQPEGMVGLTRTFEAGDASDETFYVGPEGERLVTVRSLHQFEHHETVAELLYAMGQWLMLPVPQDHVPVSPREVQIAVEPDIGLDRPAPR
jgi:hypothetical protein